MEKILKKATNFCFNEQDMTLTCDKFVKNMSEMKNELNYDFMSVSGYFFYFYWSLLFLKKNYVHYERMDKFQRKFKNKIKNKWNS